MSAYTYYQAGMYEESISACAALHPAASRQSGRRLCAVPDRVLLFRPDPRRHPRPGAHRARHAGVRRGDPQVSEFRIRRVRQAQDRRRPRPACRPEMMVGRYYMERRDYTGAINRFKIVVTRYQTTRHVEEALLRLTEAYLSLGIVGEAQTSAAVLGHNFPDSRWYKDAYALVQQRGLQPSENRELLDQPGVPQSGASADRLGRGSSGLSGRQNRSTRTHPGCDSLSSSMMANPPEGIPARSGPPRPCSPGFRSATSS